MANTEIRLSVHFRWWVKPFMALLKVFLPVVYPFVSEERFDDWAEKTGTFVAEKGTFFVAK